MNSLTIILIAIVVLGIGMCKVSYELGVEDGKKTCKVDVNLQPGLHRLGKIHLKNEVELPK